MWVLHGVQASGGRVAAQLVVVLRYFAKTKTW